MGIYDRRMNDIYRRVERARHDASYMEQLLRENAQMAKNINRRMTRIEKALGGSAGAVESAREAAREITGMDQFSRGMAKFRNDPDALLKQMQAMERFNLSRSATVAGALEYRKEATENLINMGYADESLRDDVKKQNEIFRILSSKNVGSVRDMMDSDEYVEMIVDAVEKGATAEKFEAAMDELMSKNDDMDTDEIFAMALEQSYTELGE